MAQGTGSVDPPDARPCPSGPLGCSYLPLRMPLFENSINPRVSSKLDAKQLIQGHCKTYFLSRFQILLTPPPTNCVFISSEKHLFVLWLSRGKITLDAYLETNIKLVAHP